MCITAYINLLKHKIIFNYNPKFDQFSKSYQPIPRRDSISRPIAPASSVPGGDDTTRPRLQAKFDQIRFYLQILE
jgi:hypothetical protein